MAKHTITGRKGEQLAHGFLVKLGYKILENNWRFEKKEVDIIAEDGDELVFVEVKTRSNFNFGFPEEAVNEAKQNFLKIAAEAYCFEKGTEQTIRFDIIAVLLKNGQSEEIKHFKDAFY